MGSDYHETLAEGITEAGEGLAARSALMIYHRDGLDVVPLTPGATVTIGRSPPCDVQPRSRRLSRKHARFSVDGEEVWVEDLRSTNGTFLNGTRLTGRAPLKLGDEVTLGSVSVSLHRLDPAEARVHGLESHERFVHELDEEVARARTFGRSLAVLLVRSEQGGHVGRWVARIQSRLRLVDRTGMYAPDCVEVVLPEVDRARARRFFDELAEGEDVLLSGLAVFPADGDSASDLVQIARIHCAQAGPERRLVASAEDELALYSSQSRHGPVVRDPRMLALYRTVARVAQSEISVLIVGETGTGKEVVAQAIHEQSARSGLPLRCINCGAIPEQLLESILFGHERGAFTGADRQSKGVFEESSGGAVLLDEIGELSLSAQVALLRVLETRKITRVGANREIDVDVRVFAATHRDLEQMCDEGTFRWDLFYRLNPITLEVPPLRERRSEIRPLARQFLQEANELHGRSVTGIEPGAARVLEAWSWPGNVRELRNVVDRAVVIAAGDVVTVDELPARVVAASAPAPSEDQLEDERTEALDLNLKARVQELEEDLIRAALLRTGGNQTEAAQLLDMPRRTFVYKLRSYGIEGGDPALAAHELLLDGTGPTRFRDAIEDLERKLIERALDHVDGDRARAARLLRIQRRTLLQKLERYGL